MSGLDLSYNHLYGEIPQEMGDLRWLSSLKLRNNGLSGLLPESLAQCREMFMLELGNNNFSNMNNLVDVISQFVYLDYLHLSGLVNLCGYLPSNVTRLMDLPNLTYFNITYCGFSGDIPSAVLQHPRWDDFVFYILPQSTAVNQPQGSSVGGFNMDGVTYRISDFSVKDINGNVLDTKSLRKNKLTLVFSITSGDETGLRKAYELYRDYHEKGVGIISFFKLWSTPNDPVQWEQERKWVDEMIQKYDMTWDVFIEDQFNRINNFPEWYAVGSGTDTYPLGSVIVNSERTVLYDAGIKGADGVGDFIESLLGSIADYESTDYSQGEGIDLVLLGDGFADRDISDGTYDYVMRQAAENFFSTQPVASYRSRFNVHSVKVVSRHDRIAEGNETALSTVFGEGTKISGDDNKCIEYAQRIPDYDPSRTVIVVVVNDNRYAGTCYMYDNDLAIAYCPTVDGYQSDRFVQIINHEAVGHGFAKLGDEYINDNSSEIPAYLVTQYSQQKQNGWWNNVDFTAVPAEVSWAAFLSDSRYQSEQLGVFTGGLGYGSGVYHSSLASIMNTNVGIFNAPSREAIYKRIMRLSEGAAWQYDRETFVAQDLSNIPASATVMRAARQISSDFVPLHPPVIKTH